MLFRSPVHDFGEIDGVLFIDMRLVEGTNVKDELRVNGALPPARAVSIIGQVAKALDAAHANDLVHRDIKPENVLLTPDDFAYIVDFGIAHGGGEASVTKTGLIIGSCAYMATERLNGEAGGPASDVYSLTCLLLECLTGRPPFEAKDVRQVMSAHMFTPPPRPSHLRRTLNPGFDAVIAKGMAKNPTDRYASAGELAKAAAAVLQGRPAVVAPAIRPSAPPSTRPLPVIDRKPAPTGYVPPPPTAPKRSRFSKAQLALLLGTIAMFALAGVLAAVVAFTGGLGNTGASTPLAAAPPSSAKTTVTTTPSTTTTPSPTPTVAPRGAALTGTDWLGFNNHVARCDLGSRIAAAIRTSSSLAVVCENFFPGTWYYHGENLSDGADLKLGNATPNGDGFDVTDPVTGITYQVRPNGLTLVSNGQVSSTEPAVEYGP